MSEEWYTNKELFEQILSMQDNFRELSNEMQETRRIIKKYNGLRQEIEEVKQNISKMENQSKGRKSVGDGIVKWGGYVIALLTLVMQYLIYIN